MYNFTFCPEYYIPRSIKIVEMLMNDKQLFGYMYHSFDSSKLFIAAVPTIIVRRFHCTKFKQ